MNIQTAIQTLCEGQDLDTKSMADVMRSIMTGKATPAQIGGFLVALRQKGESVDEIVAATLVMRELATHVYIEDTAHLVDTCGTGGDASGTFNISTASAIVAAAAGAHVAKHGNRSVSSHSGSADVLEAAGVNLSLTASQVAQCIQQTGLGFMFAPSFHSAMKHTIGPRREMGIRTVFNLLGPLTNPAAAPNQLIGVFADYWLEPLARVLQKLGSRHVMIVHAEDGLDEISIASKTHVAELRDGEIKTYSIIPEQFQFARGSVEDIRIQSAQQSLALINEVLANKPGAAREIVCLNAGATVYVSGVSTSLEEGVKRAEKAIQDGSAARKLEDLVRASQAMAEPITVSSAPGILEKILTRKREEISERKANISQDAFREWASEASAVRPFVKALKDRVASGRAAVIAEIKKASPSKGVLRERLDPMAIARSYEAAGACCLSVLTDRDFFQGSGPVLELARKSCSLPVLRKDFIIDIYQVFETRALGADCLLLIVAALSDELMAELYTQARQIGLDVLIEVHDESELRRALVLKPEIIGINNRDLKNFEIRLETTLGLLAQIPDDCLVITESGIHTREDVSRMREYGVHGFLVGEAFMRADDPGEKLKQLFAEG